MAFPIALALLGYGIYNKKQKEAELQEALSDTTKTPAQRIDALIQANPMMAADPRIQAMQAGIAKNDELVTAAEETRKKALWDETWKNVPAVSQEAFIRANPEEAAKYAPERTKAILEKDKNAADLKLWTDKAGITDKFTDENREQQQQVTQENAAYSAGLQRETNRQSQAGSDAASQAEFDRENSPLAIEAARQREAADAGAKTTATEQAKATAEAQAKATRAGNAIGRLGELVSKVENTDMSWGTYWDEDAGALSSLQLAVGGELAKMSGGNAPSDAELRQQLESKVPLPGAKGELNIRGGAPNVTLPGYTSKARAMGAYKATYEDLVKQGGARIPALEAIFEKNLGGPGDGFVVRGK